MCDPTLCSIGGQDLDDLRSTIGKMNKRKRKTDDGSPSDALLARAVLAIEKEVNKPRGGASVAVAQVDVAKFPSRESLRPGNHTRGVVSTTTFPFSVRRASGGST